MAVRVGSARSDEKGQLLYGLEGDQRQAGVPDMTGEVSMQTWYLHNKGWFVIRAKDSAKRAKIAYAMEAACNNAHIGYSQSNRWTAQDWCKWHNNENYDPATITKDVNVDCSALVRLCCMYAGIDTGDIYTANMPKKLGAMPDFEVISDTAITNTSDNQMKGDILCTRSSGHTVVVLDDGINIKKSNTGKYVYNGVVYDAEFDPTYYSNRYADLKAAFGTNTSKLLQHWVTYGKKEGRIAKAAKYIYKGVDYSHEFDPEYYANKYPDLKKAFGYDANKLLEHWVNFGKREKRTAIAEVKYIYNNVDYTNEFDPIYYADRYADLKKAFGYDAQKLLQHWVEYGKKEKRIAKKSIADEFASEVYAIAKTAVTVRDDSHIQGKTLGYTAKGQKVQVLKQLSNGWLKIAWDKAANGYAYTSNVGDKYYTVYDSKASETPAQPATTTFPYKVENSTDVYIRKGPGYNYATNGVVRKGEQVIITKIEDKKWAKLQDGRGYFSMAYAKKV